IIHQNIVDCGTVMADPTQIHQVLMNLCTNAYHAMRETGGELSVSLSVVELTAQDYLDNLALQPGPHVQLSVRDTGCGIEPEEVEKVFDKFVQLHDSSSPSPGSVGLGLSIAKEIVELYGGRIWVDSRVGTGSVFTFSIPIEKRIAHERKISA
ncbi:MAG TPA: ATP-binding protein, partial [Candidatus Kryptobacter bacterium]|nr:ATP-binding protein [Candidatus Kryptobacter bacterium]